MAKRIDPDEALAAVRRELARARRVLDLVREIACWPPLDEWDVEDLAKDLARFCKEQRALANAINAFDNPSLRKQR